LETHDDSGHDAGGGTLRPARHHRSCLAALAQATGSGTIHKNVDGNGVDLTSGT